MKKQQKKNSFFWDMSKSKNKTPRKWKHYEGLEILGSNLGRAFSSLASWASHMKALVVF